METALRKSYIRFIYRKLFRLLSVYLVLSAILGGIYQDRLHFIYGLSFFGSFTVLLAWVQHLRNVGMHIPQLGVMPMAKKVPYMLRRFKSPSMHKPLFLMDYRDFDDDLTRLTAAGDGQFTPGQYKNAVMWANFGCGIFLTVFSFLIYA